MLIEDQKFSDIIKLGERIKEGIKTGMVTSFEALQAKKKALQSGGTSKKKGCECRDGCTEDKIPNQIPILSITSTHISSYPKLPCTLTLLPSSTVYIPITFTSHISAYFT